MVDSISSITSLQRADTTKRTQNEEPSKGGDDKRLAVSEPKDTVQISKDAISLLQAEKAAKDVRVALEQAPDVTLGLDPNFEAKA